MVPRSQSVGIGRIDEDKCCEFSEDVKVNIDQVYPRSKSHSMTYFLHPNYYIVMYFAIETVKKKKRYKSRHFFKV